MNKPLWTDVYAPTLSDLPQDNVREYLADATTEPINLLFHGPAGVGKTAAVRALAEEAHDNPDNDLVEINVSDFFNRTKKEIRDDPRFEHFLTGKVEWTKQSSQTNKYKRQWSKRDMINHVLKEMASYAPSSGEYKTIVLDNAEDIRGDFQQALRRVMEQHYETTQFIITTRQPSKLIPPIKSRCFPLPFNNPTEDEIYDILEHICTEEDVTYDPGGLEYIAGYAAGNLRNAILAAQTVAEEDDEITITTSFETLGEVGIDQDIKEMLDKAEAGNFKDARKTLDDLLVDEGYSGQAILEEILSVAHSGRYEEDELVDFVVEAGGIDVDLSNGSSARIQLSKLLASLGTDSSPTLA